MSVQVSGGIVEDGIRDVRDLVVVHDDGDAMAVGVGIVPADDVAEIPVRIEGTETVSFETSGFSTFALVLTGNATQKETQLSSNEYFELDKYLQKGSTVGFTDNYTIYLEQAFYSDEEVITVAPARSDVILVVDQSASVSEHVQDLNDAVSVAVDKMHAINHSRFEMAKQGLYEDIDANGKTDSEIMALMEDHFMYLDGAIGFNNRVYVRYDGIAKSPLLVWDEADVRELQTKTLYIKADYIPWCNAGTPDSYEYDIQDMTRTDLAMDRAKGWVLANDKTYVDGQGYTRSTSAVVLITDGAPYGHGPEGDCDYEAESSHYAGMYGDSTNQALAYAADIKDTGALILAMFVPFGGWREFVDAKNAHDITLLPKPLCGAISVVFMSLLSSDYGAGSLPYEMNPTGDERVPFPFWAEIEGKTDYIYRMVTQNGKYPSEGFGRFIFIGEDYTDAMNHVSAAMSRLDEKSRDVNKRTYGGPGAVVRDELTDPFRITSTSDIHVYKVPRVPVDIGSDGVPVGLSDSLSLPDDAFRWGERYVMNDDGTSSSEWTEVTDLVSISVTGNTVEVSGWDYEQNRVSNMSHTYWVDGTKMSALKKRVYHEGDYGYKLVVTIPMQTKQSFGGNNVITNNPETSELIPSIPNVEGCPEWKDNAERNPNGNTYIEKYPVPAVDLTVNYENWIIVQEVVPGLDLRLWILSNIAAKKMY